MSRPEFDQTWWSFTQAIVWIFTKGASADPNLFNEDIPFDAYAHFSAIQSLSGALVDETIVAWGSIDASPPAALGSIIWDRLSIVSCWDLGGWPMLGIASPTSIEFASSSAYRAEALRDLSAPFIRVNSGEGSDTTYFRVVSDVRLRRSDVMRIWPAAEAPEDPRETIGSEYSSLRPTTSVLDDKRELITAAPIRKLGARKTRRKRDLAVAVEDYLAKKIYRGHSLKQSRGKYSISKIANLVDEHLRSKGTERQFAAVYKAVERYYERTTPPL
jgi:hypothetical protein